MTTSSVWIAIVMFTTVAVCLADFEAPRTACLQRRIEIPHELVSVGPTSSGTDRPRGLVRYGGDLRIGDLNGDGTVDFVLLKSVGGIKGCFIGAFDWQGKVLWVWGDKYRQVASSDRAGGRYIAETPTRPGPLLIADIDGDRRTEVIALVLKSDVKETSFWNTSDEEFVILDGTTGKVKRRASPKSLQTANAYNSRGDIEPSNYVHQRILACDLRGLGKPRDLVIKIGDSIIALNDRLEELWVYKNKFSEYGQHSCYVPAVGDVDADGHDEVCGGNFLIDHDGKVLWERFMARNNDSVAIADWDGVPANSNEIILSGYGQVVNSKGEVLSILGEKMVPHGQELRVGRFRSDMAGLQMAIRYDGHNGRILMANRAGEIFARFDVDPSYRYIGIESVLWDGRNKPALLYAPTALWDGHGRKAVVLPRISRESRYGFMGFMHCIAAELDKSGRESIVLYDPYATEVFIYGSRPLIQDPPTGYKHTAKQYNARIMD